VRPHAHAVIAWLLVAIVTTAGCGPRHVKTGRRVIVLGVDGLDYDLVRRLLDQGRLPHMQRLAAAGGFSPLETTIPPQSPVAWSTFITGVDPGRHGIFDFIHRDPKTMEPYLSTTRTVEAARNITIGRWQFPLQAGHVEALRRGGTFWEALETHKIETTILRMPANFPPSGTSARELSGMGTPDMLGTYGTFSFFTSEPHAFEAATVSGGVIVPVALVGEVVRSAIEGPDNPYVVRPQKTQAEFTAYIDRGHQYAKLVLGSEERLLRVGEWSDWVPVELKLLPLQSLKGECRFYLKAVNPYFELYASPINIDPLKPALPISSPAGYAGELARATGRFYTQGMPADTKGLRSHVLSTAEFLEQARLTRDESVRQYRYALDRFDDGLLFYYFGHVDQVSHMMWRAMDPQHPAYTAADRRYESVVEDLYADIDALVGETLLRLGPTDLLVVMSDHGFTSWRRSFSLNAWLRDRGYLAVRDSSLQNDPGLFANIDWSRTRAYGLGLNGLYINVRGREARGIVAGGEREALAAEIASKLRETVDPATGIPAVARVFRREDVYQLRGDEDIAPDLIIGYTKGTRVSDESATGAVPAQALVDNLDAWSGDHCMDPIGVPGILLTSRPLRKHAASLQRLAASLMAEFAIDRFPIGEQ
jgi:predicted AlkP superfamily phosphohydrolase/phosphomutase